MSINLDMDLRLEDLCWRCQGHGYMFMPASSETVPCNICKGVGYKPTEAGNILIEFLHHHWKRIATPEEE